MGDLNALQHITGIHEASEELRMKRVSPVELVEHHLRRAQAVGGKYKAFIALCEERAMRLAKAAEERVMAQARIGVLDGVPITIKDLINVAGVRTTNGAGEAWHGTAARTAPVVANLERAGAIVIGKTNLHELGMGITSDNPHYGAVRNPWDPKSSPGGSSGGSAVAIALGIGFGSVGTDTGGSVRIPAAHCGIFGLKATSGLVSTEGVSPISWSLDHVGPMAARAEDLQCLLDAMLNRSENAVAQSLRNDIRGLRVGVPKAYFNERQEDFVSDAYALALNELQKTGAVLMDIDLPGMEEIVPGAFILSKAEAGHLHRERYKAAADQLGQDVRGFLGAGRELSALTYVDAVERQRMFRAAIDAVFDDVDVLVAPTTPATPKPFDHAEVIINGTPEPMFNCMIRYTSIFNVSGHPAMSAPGGSSPDGLPVGIQFVGPFGSEDRLVRVAFAYQEMALPEHFERLAKLRAEAR
jgi:aspartyl-tRNA(Asn)/glutamyl-tRNA(Gln) amidotransferase subunit A